MPPTHLGVVTVAGKGAWQTAPAGRPWSGALEGRQDGSDTGRPIATKYRQELPPQSSYHSVLACGPGSRRPGNGGEESPNSTERRTG